MMAKMNALLDELEVQGGSSFVSNKFSGSASLTAMRMKRSRSCASMVVCWSRRPGRASGGYARMSRIAAQ